MTWTLLGSILSAFAAPAPAVDVKFYDIEVKGNDGVAYKLDRYKGQVILIVNTASKCGFTKQYKELEELYRELKPKGFVILGFPSNDFGGQEPGTDAEIKKFCEINFGVTFPLVAKAPVKGTGKQLVFKYLLANVPKSSRGEVLWNFEKFLIDRQGNVVDRYRSITTPKNSSLRAQIDRLLTNH